MCKNYYKDYICLIYLNNIGRYPNTQEITKYFSYSQLLILYI